MYEDFAGNEDADFQSDDESYGGQDDDEKV